MKYTPILLLAITIILAVLYFTFGGTILAIALGTVTLTGFVLSVFGAGIYVRHVMGQHILDDFLKVQTVNDNYDMAKMQSLSKFGSEIFRLARTQGGNADTNADAGFAPMLGMGDGVEGFTIQGLDTEELEQ